MGKGMAESAAVIPFSAHRFHPEFGAGNHRLQAFTLEGIMRKAGMQENA
jgi:hypothetical protein